MAPPARRRKKGLEPNLYETNGYYRYRHPITKKVKGMGKNKKIANAAARQLNAEFMPGGAYVEKFYVDRAKGNDQVNMADLIDRYILQALPSRKLKEGSLKAEMRRLNRIKADKGDTLLSDFTTKVCADYLDDNFTKGPYVYHRYTLKELFEFAKRKGDFESENPVLSTEKKTQDATTKERQRMTPEQYQQLYKAAPEWLQNAMDFSLITLQGLNEVVHAKFEDIDKDTNTIKIIRKKTEKNEWAFLELEISPELDAIIKRCRASNVASPFIIHRKPQRRVESELKEHWTQVLPGYLGETLRDIRNELDLFKCLPKEQRPTFHEIRSLGSHFYNKAGFSDEEYVQPLMAHSDVEMTKRYQKGHEIKWTRVRADLRISDFIEI